MNTVRLICAHYHATKRYRLIGYAISAEFGDAPVIRAVVLLNSKEPPPTKYRGQLRYICGSCQSMDPTSKLVRPRNDDRMAASSPSY
jgi:hypothetical protein